MSEVFYRFNTADEDKKLAASLDGDHYVLEVGSGAKEVRFEQVSNTLAYVGEAVPGAAEADPVWRIRRLDTTTAGNVATFYAESTANFDKVWDSRASYTY